MIAAAPVQPARRAGTDAPYQKTVQPQFDLRIPAGRVLVPIEVVIYWLDRDYEDVLNLITIGSLQWAWDVRCAKNHLTGAATDRSEIRIWQKCFLDYGRMAEGGWRTTSESEKEIYGSVFAKHGERIGGATVIRAAALARRWSVDSQHVARLLAEGSIEAAPEKLGPKESPAIYCASAIEFLKMRRVA